MHVLSFTGNYHLFAHSDVSYRFNGKNDNICVRIMYNHKPKYVNANQRGKKYSIGVIGTSK